MKHRYILLLLTACLVGFGACKTDAVKPAVEVTIVGKWFVVQHNLKLIKDGVQVGETVRTTYTKDDFAQFFEDGSGYQSAEGTTVAPSLSIFHYTISGNVITLYINGSRGIDETITKLTESELSVHYESQIPDPIIAGKFNTEIDDYAFKR
ncbi:MAG TPA: lipocalin family protein [Mucilaginibacter sp.]